MKLKKTLLAAGAAAAISLAGVSAASADMHSSQMGAKAGMHAAGSCGTPMLEKMNGHNGKCGSGKMMKEHGGKCGNGKCGATSKSKSGGKCGHGKCGSANNMHAGQMGHGKKMEKGGGCGHGKCGGSK